MAKTTKKPGVSKKPSCDLKGSMDAAKIAALNLEILTLKEKLEVRDVEISELKKLVTNRETQRDVFKASRDSLIASADGYKDMILEKEKAWKSANDELVKYNTTLLQRVERVPAWVRWFFN